MSLSFDFRTPKVEMIIRLIYIFVGYGSRTECDPATCTRKRKEVCYKRVLNKYSSVGTVSSCTQALDVFAQHLVLMNKCNARATAIHWRHPHRVIIHKLIVVLPHRQKGAYFLRLRGRSKRRNPKRAIKIINSHTLAVS